VVAPVHTGCVPAAVDLRRWSLARQLLLLQGALVLVVVLVGFGLAWADAADDAREAAAAQVTAVARSVADSPDVRDAVGADDPTRLMQPYAEQVRRDTGTDFVVVMSRERVRWSHPDPEQIGREFLGTVSPALRGETFTETFTGTLGPSVRAVTPVLDDDGRVVALVSVGLSVQEVDDQLRAELPLIGVAALAVLVIAGVGTVLVSRRLRRLTYGLGAEELSRMYASYDAVLHSVREGLVVLDPAGRVQLANDEARRLLDLPEDLAGRRADELGLPGGLVAVLAGHEVVDDAVHLARDRVVVVSAAPAEVDGQVLGRVVTLRDRTDLRALAGDLDAARGLAESLRAQAHESANRLHTVVSLLELGRTEEAVGFAVEELTTVQALTDRVVGAVEEPVVAAVLLGKSSVAAERGVDLVLAEGTELDAESLRGSGVAGRDVVTLLGNLLDNAVDAASSGPAPRWVEVLVRRDGVDLLLEVADSGEGLDPSCVEEAFTRGWTTKPVEADRPQGRGLGLALVGQTVRRLGGTVEVGRRRGAVFTVRLPLTQPVPA